MTHFKDGRWGKLRELVNGTKIYVDYCQNPKCPYTKRKKTSKPHLGNGLCTSCYEIKRRDYKAQYFRDHYGSDARKNKASSNLTTV